MMLSVSPGYQLLLTTPSVSPTFMMLSVSAGYQLLWITPSVFSYVNDVVCVCGLSITLDYPFGVLLRLWCCLCLRVINYSWLPLRCSLTFMMLSVSPGYQLLCIAPSVSLTFMMLFVSPGYQLLLITPSVFSYVYDVVCVSGLSFTLDYPFGVL